MICKIAMRSTSGASGSSMSCHLRRRSRRINARQQWRLCDDVDVACRQGSAVIPSVGYGRSPDGGSPPTRHSMKDRTCGPIASKGSGSTTVRVGETSSQQS
jgi:hypothetical protein